MNVKVLRRGEARLIEEPAGAQTTRCFKKVPVVVLDVAPKIPGAAMTRKISSRYSDMHLPEIGTQNRLQRDD